MPRRLMSRPRPSTLALRAALAVAGGAASLLAGCYTEGGGQMSMDRFTYVSTPSQPKTITLVDTRTFESIWSIDVPVGQQVAVQFIKDSKGEEGVTPDAYRPDIMRWSLMKAYNTSGELDNAIAVPPSYCRRLEMKLRPSPEMPDATATISNKPVKQLGYNDETPPEFKKKAPVEPTTNGAPATAPGAPPPASGAQPMPADAPPPPPPAAGQPAEPPVDLPPK